MNQLTWTQAKVSHQRGVAGTEAVRELGYECLQVLATLLGGVDVPEEISQRVGQELVAEVVQCHQLI